MAINVFNVVDDMHAEMPTCRLPPLISKCPSNHNVLNCRFIAVSQNVNWINKTTVHRTECCHRLNADSAYPSIIVELTASPVKYVHM